MNRKSLFILAALACSVVANAAFWSDNFDSYVAGSNIAGQGGWNGWEGNAAAGGIVSSDYANSPSNSLRIDVPDDTVQQFSGVTSGKWRFTARQFIADKTDGDSWFILLNKYSIVGAKGWGIQLKFAADGLIYDDLGDGLVGSYVSNQWATLTFDIDLDAGTQTVLYNNNLLTSRQWGINNSYVNEIAALDLYSQSDTRGVYYDDLSLEAVPEPFTMAIGLAGLGVAIARRRRKA